MRQRHWLMATICSILAATGAYAQETRPLAAADLWKIKRVGSPSIAPDGNLSVVEVTTWDVDKDESSSNLWLLVTDGKTQKQLTYGTGKNSGPRWSPDGKWIAFTSKRGDDAVPQVYVISPTGGEARRVSKMAAAPSGLKWSEDSQTIFCIGWTWPDARDDTDHAVREKAEKERKAKAVIIDDAHFRMWDHWISDGKRPMIFAIDVASGRHQNLLAKSKRFLPPTDPPPTASDFDISPDGKELAFTSDSAPDYGTDFNSDLYLLPLDGHGRSAGDPKNLTTDNPASDTQPAYSPEGKHLAFLRQTNKKMPADRQRLMLFDRDAKMAKELPALSDRSSQSPRWIDAKRISIEAENGGVKGIYFVDLEGKPAWTKPPEVSEQSIDFARGKRLAVYLRSSFDRPPAVFAHGPGMKDPVPLEHFNDELVAHWKFGKFESATFRGAANRDVQHWIFYPPEFDRSKKWPLVQVVHGGPFSAIINDWSFRWNPQLWAAQGYVIACVNFHGSTGYGQAFTDSILGAMEDKPFTDVMNSTDWFAAQSWIDKDRIAAAGGSYGGYMMAWLNGHTDRFRTMICHAGVYDWHAMQASDVIKFREYALGAAAWGDPTITDRQSPQRFAANFKTPTLVLHGEKDFRVPFTQGLAYYNTLRHKGVPTRLVYFPDENHWILKPNNSLLWHQEVFAWLDKHIGRGYSQ
jgi:dipeptidyl aminopeptidase/acylaminoacyl peptidase